MLTFIVAVVLLTMAVVSVMLRKAYNVVPARELGRQAAGGNALAQQLQTAVTYGASLRALLWITTTFTLTGGLVVLGRNSAWYVSFMVAVVMVWLLFSWLPNTRIVGFDMWLARQLNSSIVWLLGKTDRFLQALMRLVGRAYKAPHSGLYELTDLLDLLDLQASQPDSRITVEEIDLIRHALRFGDRQVKDVLLPRGQVKTVAAADAVGPILLDELHASNQTSFPVRKSARSQEIVGTLHVSDVGIHSDGTVEKYMSAGVAFVRSSDSLSAALHTFYQTHRQLFIVLDEHETYCGVLTLEAILNDLVSKPSKQPASTPQADETVVE